MQIYSFRQFGIRSEIKLNLRTALGVPIRTHIALIDHEQEAVRNGTNLIGDFKGIGRWWVSPDHALILVNLDVAASQAQVADITCRVLTRGLGVWHGDLILHAASVAHSGRSIILIGASGTGKSTLAFGLSQRGYSVLSDDNVPIFKDHGAFQTFGSTWALRLTEESLAMHGLPATNPKLGNKYLIPTTAQVFDTSIPVAAVFLLDGSDRSPCSLPPATAIFEILRSLWNWKYVERKVSQSQLALVSELVRSVPVRRINRSDQPGVLTIAASDSPL